MNISTQLRPLILLLHRYHLTVFVVFVLGGLSIILFSINQTVSSSTATTTSSSTTNSNLPSFDKATIQKIDALPASGAPSTPLNLSGRYNPFSE